MHRLLDVLFQHLRWLAVCLVAVPLVVAAGTLWVDGSSVVTARVRADPASFVGDALTGVLPPDVTPARSATALIGQLVATDWFSERLLTSPQAAALGLRSAQQRRTELEDLRARLRVTDEGRSLVSLRYATDRPERDTALLRLLLPALGDAVSEVASQRAAAALQVATQDLERARQDMQRALDEVNRHASLAGSSGDAQPSDPAYGRLVAAAQAATAHYEDLGALTAQAQQVSSEAPQLRRQALVVVDAPTVEPAARLATAARSWLLGVAGTATLGALGVYLIALHDPRLRALEDLGRDIPAACLLSLPPAGRRPPA